MSSMLATGSIGANIYIWLLRPAQRIQTLTSMLAMV